ncbi:hypothetical protein Sjap_013132 [Stephania japonica]|uniref:Uncharacterized protein n=1 Tax=Stephania japonica TaxID=461633 RepID=A0AAP0IY52_9MAGN
MVPMQQQLTPSISLESPPAITPKLRLSASREDPELKGTSSLKAGGHIISSKKATHNTPSSSPNAATFMSVRHDLFKAQTWLDSFNWFSFLIRKGLTIKIYQLTAKGREGKIHTHIDQWKEVLWTPTREEIKCMNPNYTEFKFPQIKAHPWHKLLAFFYLEYGD